MRPEKLEQALSYIRDTYIAEAAEPKKRHPIHWMGAIAAVLALVLLFQAFPLSQRNNTSDMTAADAPAAEAPAAEEELAEDTESPMESASTSTVSRYALALSAEPRVTEHPNWEAFDDSEEYEEVMYEWNAQQDTRRASLNTALQNLTSFFTESSKVFLTDAIDENQVYSPVNSYIALAMLAEVTGGNSRQQILDVLNTQDLDSLRSQVSAVWESVYCDSDAGTSILANSLWLDEGMSYHQEALDSLAYHHYASSYQGDLGSEEMNEVLRAWMNEQTGGLLKNSIDDLELSPDSILALASTVYLRSYWNEEFNPDMNTEDVFYSPDGQITSTFMNKPEFHTNYYRGENYGAVCLDLMNGCGMWLFLPDEGTEVSALVESGSYMDTILTGFEDPGRQYLSVNLSVPRFDVSSSEDLMRGLQELGITDVFSQDSADFTPSIDAEVPVYVGSVSQAARVSIDEEGAEAASYVLLDSPTSAAPEELPTMDFVLDRPFLFVIERSDLPLFTGIVNEP